MVKTILALIVSIIVAQAAGAIGSFFTAGSVSNWYAYLEKPAFSPPNFLFAPVWLALYVLMGLAAFLVWRKRQAVSAKSTLWLYLVHLAFNAAWSVIFFGLHSPGWAFLEILVLWLLIALVGFKFFKISRLAGILFAPYFLWVSFAAVLNFFIWRLNLVF